MYCIVNAVENFLDIYKDVSSYKLLYLFPPLGLMANIASLPHYKVKKNVINHTSAEMIFV